MGTKREIAPAVADVVNSAAPGIVLDIFAGMCSVGEALAQSRQVWTNDVQIFAFEVATALFTDCDLPLDRLRISDFHFDIYLSHKDTISKAFISSINKEEKLLESQNFETFEARYNDFKECLALDLAKFAPGQHSLFTSVYADTFFGLRQSVEIDSILAAIDHIGDRGTTTFDQRRWLKIALGRAMLRTANSTGHFAQYLKPKVGSFRTFLRQRRREIWAEWLNSSDEIEPVGANDWRKGNKSFNKDCLNLLPQLSSSCIKPSVIYADPPYTDDQYSRYYHILETLILYDYPKVSGAGVYRTDRFRTPFSIKTQVASALDSMVKSIADTGADIVLSYPTNGLLYEAGYNPQEIMRKHFSRVETCYAISHDHSTFGASKGLAKSQVTEQIFLGRL